MKGVNRWKVYCHKEKDSGKCNYNNSKFCAVSMCGVIYSHGLAVQLRFVMNVNMHPRPTVLRTLDVMW